MSCHGPWEMLRGREGSASATVGSESRPGGQLVAGRQAHRSNSVTRSLQGQPQGPAAHPDSNAACRTAREGCMAAVADRMCKQDLKERLGRSNRQPAAVQVPAVLGGGGVSSGGGSRQCSQSVISSALSSMQPAEHCDDNAALNRLMARAACIAPQTSDSQPQ